MIRVLPALLALFSLGFTTQDIGLGTEIASVTAKGTIRYYAQPDYNTYRIKDRAIYTSDNSKIMGPQGPNTAAIKKFPGMMAGPMGSGGPLNSSQRPLLQANLEVEAKTFLQADGRRIVTGKLSFETRDKKVLLYAPIIHAEIPTTTGCVLTARGFHEGSPFFIQVWIQGALKSAQATKQLFLVILTPTDKPDSQAPKEANAVLWSPYLHTFNGHFFSGGAYIKTAN